MQGLGLSTGAGQAPGTNGLSARGRYTGETGNGNQWGGSGGVEMGQGQWGNLESRTFWSRGRIRYRGAGEAHEPTEGAELEYINVREQCRLGKAFSVHPYLGRISDTEGLPHQ